MNELNGLFWIHWPIRCGVTHLRYFLTSIRNFHFNIFNYTKYIMLSIVVLNRYWGSTKMLAILKYVYKTCNNYLNCWCMNVWMCSILWEVLILRILVWRQLPFRHLIRKGNIAVQQLIVIAHALCTFIMRFSLSYLIAEEWCCELLLLYNLKCAYNNIEALI